MIPFACHRSFSWLSQGWGRLVTTVCLMGLLLLGWTSLAQAVPIPPQLDRLEAQINQLQTLVDQQDWPEIRFYLNGPMGYTRKDLLAVTLTLPKAKRREAQQLSRQIADRMVDIDQASRRFDAADTGSAQRQLKQVFQSFKDLVATS